jgi:hypothetical protein
VGGARDLTDEQREAIDWLLAFRLWAAEAMGRQEGTIRGLQFGDRRPPARARDRRPDHADAGRNAEGDGRT